MTKQKKQYTLTFFVGSKNGTEILESIDTNIWFEISEDMTPIIYCIDEKENSSVAYPSSNLRKIVTHFTIESEDCDCSTSKPQLRGYA